MRVHESSSDDLAPRTPLTQLSEADGQVFDALLEARRAGGKPRTDDARTQKVAELMALLDKFPAATPSLDLTAKTMARIRQQRVLEREVETVGSRGLMIGQFRWAEFGAVAAMLVIGVSLLWPSLERVRTDARATTCQSKLARAGMAIGQYANDFANTMPRRGTWPGATWWNVGKNCKSGQPIESNSAHLFTLVRQGYTKPSGLHCPDNQVAVAQHMDTNADDWPYASAVSFSYHNQFTPTPTRIDQSPRLAVLADKNPLFVGRSSRCNNMKFSEETPTDAPSRFHRKRGQNILFADGSASWSLSPVLENGDNIWLINGVTKYRGNEIPTDPRDSFLVP